MKLFHALNTFRKGSDSLPGGLLWCSLCQLCIILGCLHSSSPLPCIYPVVQAPAKYSYLWTCWAKSRPPHVLTLVPVSLLSLLLIMTFITFPSANFNPSSRAFFLITPRWTLCHFFIQILSVAFVAFYFQQISVSANTGIQKVKILFYFYNSYLRSGSYLRFLRSKPWEANLQEYLSASYLSKKCLQKKPRRWGAGAIRGRHQEGYGFRPSPREGDVSPILRGNILCSKFMILVQCLKSVSPNKIWAPRGWKLYFFIHGCILSN